MKRLISMNTKEVMKLSLKLAGLKTVPEDSSIYVSGEKIKKVLFGIDIAVSELLLAKQLGYDAVIAHHPIGGTAVTDFHEVFKRHIQQMIAAGISKTEAQQAIQKKLEQLEVENHTRNYSHTVDAAKLLKIPFMNVHTPLDVVGRKIMTAHISRRTDKNSTVLQVVSALEELPEFKNATTKIKIRMGSPKSLAGRVVVSHGAGTNGGYEIAKTYFKHDIGTVIYIHINYGDLEKLRADGIGNLIITGHIASDSIGINPFIRELKRKGIKVTTLGVVQG
jgi:putative NIF3 family GTP cyclohydrolase 1 type 2